MTESSRPVLQPLSFPAPPTRTRTATPAREPATEEAAAPPATGRRRTSSPREPKPGHAKTGPSVVAARIPQPLYDRLVRHVALEDVDGQRPSYAQVVTWVCEEQGDAVADRVAESLLAARPDRHAPRGARRAAGSTVAVSLRFFPDELAIVTAVQDAASQHTDLPLELQGKVTRTAVITAAIEVGVPDSVS